MTTLIITSEKTDITSYLSTEYVSLLQNIGNNIVWIEKDNNTINLINSSNSFYLKKTNSTSTYYVYTSPNVRTELTITKAAYQNDGGGGGGDITAGTGLVFDGTTLNHINSVQSNINNTLKTFRYDTEGHITDGTDIAVQKGLSIDNNNILGHSTITQGQSIGATTNTDYKSVFFTYDNFGHIISGTSQPLKINDNFREPNQTGLFTVAGAYDLYNSIESGGYTLYVYSEAGNMDTYMDTLPKDENWILATTNDGATGAVVDLTETSILFIKHTLMKTNTTPYNWVEEAYRAPRGDIIATRSYCDWMGQITEWRSTQNLQKDISDKFTFNNTLDATTSRCVALMQGTIVQAYFDFTTLQEIAQGSTIVLFDNTVRPYIQDYYFNGFEVVTTTQYWFYFYSSTSIRTYRPIPANTRIIMCLNYIRYNTYS